MQLLTVTAAAWRASSEAAVQQQQQQQHNKDRDRCHHDHRHCRTPQTPGQCEQRCSSSSSSSSSRMLCARRCECAYIGRARWCMSMYVSSTVSGCKYL
eukprot:14253-Heterococcus_DN1.PRE.1